MNNNNFNAISPIEENVGAQAAVDIQDNQLTGQSSLYFDCCGLFGGGHNSHNEYGEGGISESSDQNLSMFSCCNYEKSESNSIGEDGVNESTSEGLTCCGLSCGYESSCENGIPTCRVSGDEKCELDNAIGCISGTMAAGANAVCETIGCVLSILD